MIKSFFHPIHVVFKTFISLFSNSKNNLTVDQMADYSDISNYQMTENVMRLLTMPAHTIMTPRADIVWINSMGNDVDALKIIEKYPYHYFLVCQDSLDKVLGKISLKKLILNLKFNTNEKISEQSESSHPKNTQFKKYLEEVLFISPALSCLDLILKMREHNNHMALIVDEFGGIDGLVTLADIIQKVLAEIDFEPSQLIKPFVNEDSQTIIMDGRTPIKNFEHDYGLILTAQERQQNPETISGLVLIIGGRVPSRGEMIEHSSGVIFQILSGDARRVKRLQIYNLNKLKTKSS